MHNSLAVIVTLSIAVVCGVAQWPSKDSPQPQRAVAPPAPLARPLPAGADEDLVNALAVLLQGPPRQPACIGDRFGVEMMLSRRLPPSALSQFEGAPLRELAAGEQQIALRLLEHFAATLGHARAAADWRAVASQRLPVSLAVAGTPTGSLYLRLHSERFAVEWVREANGTSAAWRDFAADAGETCLRDRIAGRSGQR